MQIQYLVNQLASNQKYQAGISPPQVKRVHLPPKKHLPPIPTNPPSFCLSIRPNLAGIINIHKSASACLFGQVQLYIHLSNHIHRTWMSDFLSALPDERRSFTFAVVAVMLSVTFSIA